MNFSPPQWAKIASPLPTRSLACEQLFEGWLLSTGGITEDVGYGISSDRQGQYQTAIREFKRETTYQPPSWIIIEKTKTWVRWLHSNSSYAPVMHQQKLLCPRNICKIAENDGVIYSNLLNQPKVATPDSTIDQSACCSVTHEEPKLSVSINFHLVFAWPLIAEQRVLRLSVFMQCCYCLWFSIWGDESLGSDVYSDGISLQILVWYGIAFHRRLLQLWAIKWNCHGTFYC